MQKEKKTVIYDGEMKIVAYRFQGMERSFPNHFHEYYVIGLMESGERDLVCRGRTYRVGKGGILIFNPGDSYGCSQTGEGPLVLSGKKKINKLTGNLPLLR